VHRQGLGLGLDFVGNGEMGGAGTQQSKKRGPNRKASEKKGGLKVESGTRSNHRWGGVGWGGGWGGIRKGSKLEGAGALASHLHPRLTFPATLHRSCLRLCACPVLAAGDGLCSACVGS
jgi:hypothetical protein